MARRLFFVAAVVCLSLALAGPAAAKQVTLTWSAGSAGGGWYGMAGGIAAIIKKA